LTDALTTASIFVARPDVLQADFLAVGVHAQHVLLDVEADGAGNGVGHHQRRRGQEGLLGVRVDAAVEVAVARQHGGGVQVAVDDLLLDHRIQRAGHAVAGGAGEGDDAEAEFFQFVARPASSRYRPRFSSRAPATT
jgi:hypothetical protein